MIAALGVVAVVVVVVVVIATGRSRPVCVVVVCIVCIIVPLIGDCYLGGRLGAIIVLRMAGEHRAEWWFPLVKG